MKLIILLIINILYLVGNGVFKTTVVLKKTFDVFEKTLDVFEKHLTFSKKQRYVFFDGLVKLELFSNENKGGVPTTF